MSIFSWEKPQHTSLLKEVDDFVPHKVQRIQKKLPRKKWLRNGVKFVKSMFFHFHDQKRKGRSWSTLHKTSITNIVWRYCHYTSETPTILSSAHHPLLRAKRMIYNYNIKPLEGTVDGRNPASQLIRSWCPLFAGLSIHVRWDRLDFWTINSITWEFSNSRKFCTENSMLGYFWICQSIFLYL